MSFLTFVRHAQASFLSDDYDRLSALGERQSRLLGEFWAANGIGFDAVYCGPRQRQIRTGEIAGIAAGSGWPEPVVLAEFDEYQAEALARYCFPELARTDARVAELAKALEDASVEERPRVFERLFQEITSRWVRGEVGAPEVEPWSRFRERVHRAVAQIVSSANSGSRIVIFTSAGPVSTAVQYALGLSDSKTLELSWMVRNASCTEFVFSGDRFSVSSFNAHPHLGCPELLTYR